MAAHAATGSATINSPAPVLSLHQLADCSGIDERDLRELVECGLITPASGLDGCHFSVESIGLLQRAARLQDELALDGHALAVAVMLLRTIIDLETQLRDLERDKRVPTR
jgi:MerR HTH family regulatory protein